MSTSQKTTDDSHNDFSRKEPFTSGKRSIEQSREDKCNKGEDDIATSGLPVQGSDVCSQCVTGSYEKRHQLPQNEQQTVNKASKTKHDIPAIVKAAVTGVTQEIEKSTDSEAVNVVNMEEPLRKIKKFNAECSDDTTNPDFSAKDHAGNTSYSMFNASDGSHMRNTGDNSVNIMIVTSKEERKERKETKGNIVQKVLKRINKDSVNRTFDKICADFEHEHLPEPECKVYPRIARWKNFFKGVDVDASHVSLDKYCPTKSKPKSFSEHTKKEFLSFDSVMDIIRELPDEKKGNLGLIGLVAQPGAGKTTCMKRWARALLDESGITSNDGYIAKDDSRFRLVIFVDLKSIESRKKTSLQKFLFGGYCHNKDERNLVYDWADANQSNIAIFFDGFDQTDWFIDKKNTAVLGPCEKASTESIIGNIFSRNFLPNARIIVASREFKVAALPLKARPKTIITLLGFDEDVAKNLFNELVLGASESSTAEDMSSDSEVQPSQNWDENLSPWENLKINCSSLISFLTIPVYLVFTVLLYRSSRAPLPQNVTDLLTQILLLLEGSENVLHGEDINPIIQKLKGLAYDGMKNGTVVFKKADLNLYNLKHDDVNDLLRTIPRGKVLSQRLSDRDFSLIFCHQIFQDFLSACYIAEMNLLEFKRFAESQLHQDRWSAVRRFVFGVVFTQENQRLTEINSREVRKLILRKSLASLVDSSEGRQLLDIYACVFESGDPSIVTSQTNKINLSYTQLASSDINLVGWIISHYNELSSVNLRSCGLNDGLIRTMAQSFGERKVPVKLLELTRNPLSFSAFNLLHEKLVVAEVQLFSDDLTGPEGLNWENLNQVTFISMTYKSMTMKKENDLVRIQSEVICAVFNLKDRSLKCGAPTKDWSTIVRRVAYGHRLFHPISITIDGDFLLPQQYLEYAFFEGMLVWNVPLKMPKVFLNFRDAPKIEQSRIESFVHKYETKELDLGIQPRQLDLPCIKNNDLQVSGCDINVYVCHAVNNTKDTKALISTLMTTKVYNLRVFVNCKAQEEDIKTLVESCNLKKITLVVQPMDSDIAGIEKLKELADFASVEFEVHTHDSDQERTALWHLDWSMVIN